MPVLERNKTVPIRDMLLWTAVLPRRVPVIIGAHVVRV